MFHQIMRCRAKQSALSSVKESTTSIYRIAKLGCAAYKHAIEEQFNRARSNTRTRRLDIFDWNPTMKFSKCKVNNILQREGHQQ